MHCWPGRDLPQKTPIVNLYNVEDGVKPAGTTGSFHGGKRSGGCGRHRESNLNIFRPDIP